MQDPGNLISIREKPTDRYVTRTPSQTILGVTQASPLGSHSPFAPLHQSKRAKSAERVATIAGHRRRNTLPSIVFSDQDAQQIRTVVDRDSAKPAPEISSSNEQTAQMPKALKRRSRSADALTDLVASQVQSPTTWRQSLLDQPLPQFETKGGKKTGTGMSTTRSSRLNSTVSSNSLKPVQNFDFGLLGDASLEDRVKTLEIKCINFEYAIAGLQGYDVGTQVLASRPLKRRSIHDLFLETNAPPSSRATSGQVLTFLKSPTDTSSLSDEDRRQIHRSSATTIKASYTTTRSRSPKRSAAPSPSTTNAKGEQYGELLAMIKEERAARKQLEAQVLELQKQIVAYATTQPYAAPSPESLYTESAETRARPLHRTPAFPRRSRNNLTAETSRFSVSDTEESETDGGFHDVYETPQKNKFTFSSTELSLRPTVEIF